MNSVRFRGFCHVLLLLLLVWLIYARTLTFGYVWDDAELFVNSTRFRFLHSMQEWWYAVASPVLPMTTYFRPLVLSTYVAQFSLFGLSAVAAHLVNVLIFSANVVLVYLLCRHIFERFKEYLLGLTAVGWAVLASVVYAMHPAHIESVVWISGRFDLMVTFFALLNLLLTVVLSGCRQYIGFGVTLLLALLSKEMAVTLVLIAPTLRWVIRDAGVSVVRREAIRYTALGLLVLMVYVALKWLGMSGNLIHSDVSLGNMEWWRRVAYVGWTLGFYLKTFIWPFSDISPTHPFDPRMMTVLQLSWGWFLLLFCAFLGIYSLLARNALCILIVLSLLTLAPVSNIVLLTIGGEVGCERFMAFPLALLVPALLVFGNVMFSMAFDFGKGWRIFCCLCSFWLIVAGFNVWVTVPLWQSDFSLWLWVNSKHPENIRGQLNLASAYYRIKDYKAMDDVVDRSLKLGGPPDRFNLILGAARIRQGREYEGVELIEKTLENFSLPHKMVQGMNGGLVEFQADTRWYVNSKLLGFAYLSLSEGYRGLGRFDEALEAVNVSDFYDSRLTISGLVRAFALYGVNRKDDAERVYADTFAMLTPDDQQRVPAVRRQYLNWLCEKFPERAPSVCVGTGVRRHDGS